MDAREGLAAGLSEAKGVGSSLMSSGHGSPAAIALAGVATLVVAGVVLAKHEYNKHQSKKHLTKVKEVLALYKTYLVDISETGLDEHPTLPPPFVLDHAEDPKSAKALKLTMPLRLDLIHDKSVSNDAYLLQYGHHIKNAKVHLQGFYDVRLSAEERSPFTRGSEDDVTSSVLTYLLVMLSEHCTKFEGYQVDMAILEGLIRFTNAFASMKRKTRLERSDPKRRQRFERLKMVCKELRKAKKLLFDHSNSRTLKSYVDELMSACNKDLVPELNTIFAKFIVPKKDWSLVDAATPELLAAGLVQPEYKNAHTVLPRKEVAIPASPFKIWLQKIVVNYLDPDNEPTMSLELKEEDWVQVKALFKLCPNFLTLKSPQPKEDGSYATSNFVPVGFDEECQVRVLSKMPELFEPHSFLVIRDERGWKLYEVKEDRRPAELKVEEVRDLQQALAALPARKPAESLSKREKRGVNAALTNYRNLSQLKARTQIFLDLALLMDQLADLDQFCEKLSDCIRDLGEIYVANPHHCNFIFESLAAFGKDINNRIGVLLKSLDRVEEEQDSANDMLIQEQLALMTQLNSKLLAVRDKVSSNINGIMDTHNIHSTRSGDPKACGRIDCEQYEREQKKRAIQGMLMLATQVAAKYRIDTRKYDLSRISPSVTPVTTAMESKAEAKGSGPSTPVLGGSPFSPRRSPFFAGSPGLGESKYGAPGGYRRLRPVLLRRTESSLINADTVLRELRLRLDGIYAAEQTDIKTQAAYERLYDALNALDLKAKIMEKEKEPARRAKAEATQKLAAKLCQDTLTFCKLEKTRRVEEAVPFMNKLRDELFASRNRFLDEHKSLFSHILRAAMEVALCLLGYGFYLAYKRGGFFNTCSRAAAHQVGEGGAELTKRLATPVA